MRKKKSAAQRLTSRHRQRQSAHHRIRSRRLPDLASHLQDTLIKLHQLKQFFELQLIGILAKVNVLSNIKIWR